MKLCIDEYKKKAHMDIGKLEEFIGGDYKGTMYWTPLSLYRHH